MGDAYIDVHANTKPFADDLNNGLGKASQAAEPEAVKAGQTLGADIGDGVEKEFGRRGPRLAHTLGEAVEKEVVTVKPNFRYDVRGSDGRFIKRAAANIREEVEEAFAGAGGGAGNIFSKIGQGVADAIGSGFNVSGKSPLIYLLAPVYAAIAGLVVAAIQAANGVVAALLAIPAALSVVAVEVGVLFLAFHGVGEAIQGAFAATNAQELTKALEGLTPKAQGFVKALLPAKGLFKSLVASAQENFFAFLGGGEKIAGLISAISGPLKAGVPVVAAALGRFFGQLTDFFRSPLFSAFLERIFPATAKIIEMLSGPFVDALTGLFLLIVHSLPFLIALAARFGGLLSKVGDLLAGVSPDWLDDMLATLDATFDLVGELIALFAVLAIQTNAAGGEDFIKFLVDTVEVIKNFMASDLGEEAIAGIIRLAEISIILLLGVLAVIVILLAGFQALTDAIGTAGAWIVDVLWPNIKKFWSFVSGIMSDAFGAILTQVAMLPDQAKALLANISDTLRIAGRNLIQGFINGIKDQFGSVKAALGGLTSLLPDWKGPESKDKTILEPAGVAVMEGFGTGLKKGADDIHALLGDFTNGLGIGVNSNTTNIGFGANAIAVNFRGALPSQDQAMATGLAVGSGINGALATRNTRLAVRTL